MTVAGEYRTHGAHGFLTRGAVHLDLLAMLVTAIITLVPIVIIMIGKEVAAAACIDSPLHQVSKASQLLH